MAPLDTVLTPEPHDASLDDRSLQKIDDELPKRDVDNSVPRTDAPVKDMSKFDRPLRVDNDEPLEVDHVDLSALEAEV